MRVVISGAGLAGLTLANTLYRNGIEVVVCEAADALESQDPGYRIHMNSTGTAALHAALEPQLWELCLATAGIPRQEMLHFDHELNLAAARDVSLSRGRGVDVDGLPEHVIVSRMTLRRVLELGLPAGAVRFGSGATGFDVEADGTVAVRLADGTTLDADVFVCAEGVNSATARMRLPGLEVVDLGARHIAGKIPLDEHARAVVPAELFSTFSMCHGSGGDAITFAPIERADAQSALVGAQSAEFRAEATTDFALCMFSWVCDESMPDSELFTAAPAELREFVRHRMRTWDDRLRGLVDLWDLATVKPLTLRSAVPIAAWEPGPVTVMGDAVHAMSPALGIGANTALRDAHVLGDALVEAARTGGSVVAAVGRYEQAMRDYGFTAVRNSAEMGTRVIGHRALPLPAG